MKVIHDKDEVEGANYRPPPAKDGTPSDSINDVLVRANQLVATMESMYSGENILIVAPDSEILSILTAALSDKDPDSALPTHAKFFYTNGEFRRLDPFVQISTLKPTGQTVEEANKSSRKMKALRVGPSAESRANLRSAQKGDWYDIWKSADTL